MTDEPVIVREGDLEFLPEGVYAIGTDVDGVLTVKRKIGDYFDVYDDKTRNGPLILLARIRAGRNLPAGVESITIRGDGKQVITAWAPDPI